MAIKNRLRADNEKIIIDGFIILNVQYYKKSNYASEKEIRP